MVASNLFTSSDALPPLASERATAQRQEADDDATLVSRFNRGDESAFVAIVTRHRERMFSLAMSVVRNRADAEEIAQDTFIRAHRGLIQFRGDSALVTWLHGIALNLSRNRYWYNLRRRQNTMLSLDSTFSDDNEATVANVVACNAPGPVRVAETAEFTELVAGCMQHLGPGARDILTRRNLLSCSYDEIARSFGISIGTTKSRIARARDQLRTLLDKACPEFTPDASHSDWFDPVRTPGRQASICAQ